MTQNEAQTLIDKVEHKLYGISANNYFKYQVGYHLDEFKRTGKYAEVLQHYINNKPIYLHHKVFYFHGVIIDRNKMRIELYSKICRHKVWKKISRISKKSLL